MLSRVYYHNQLCQTSAQYLASHLANLGLSQVTLIVRNLPANAGDIRDTSSIPELGRYHWRREWQPTPSVLAWKIL